MLIKSALLFGLLGYVLIFFPLQLHARDQSAFSEYRFVSIEPKSRPSKLELSSSQERLLESYVLEQFGEYYGFQNRGAYKIDDQIIYVKLYAGIQNEFFAEWGDLQDQRVLNGKKRQPSIVYDLVLIDVDKGTVQSVGIPFIPEDGVLRFEFPGCLSGKRPFQTVLFTSIPTR